MTSMNRKTTRVPLRVAPFVVGLLVLSVGLGGAWAAPEAHILRIDRQIRYFPKCVVFGTLIRQPFVNCILMRA